MTEPAMASCTDRHGNQRQERHQFSRGVRAWWRKMDGWALVYDLPVEHMALADAPVEQALRVTQVLGRGRRLRHLLEMGIFPGAEITLISSDPEDGSVSLKVGEAHLTMGRQVARSVLVETSATS